MVQSVNSGRLIKAPENFLSQDGIRTVFAEGKKGRRDFIRNAFAAAAAGAAVPAALAQTNPLPVEGGDHVSAHTRNISSLSRSSCNATSRSTSRGT